MPESQHPSTGCFSGSAPIDLTSIDELETGYAQPENDSEGNQSDAEDWDEGGDLTYSGIPLNVHLSRAEETLSCLLNKHGTISGNKVQYGGTMVNGTAAEHTQHCHAAKWRAIEKEVQDSIRKTQANGKKQMICNFFHSHHKPDPNASIPCDPPLTVSNSDMNSDEIEQAFGDACCEIECILDNPGEEIGQIPNDKAPAELPHNADAIGSETDDMLDMTQQLEPPRSPEIMDLLIVPPCLTVLEESLAQTHHHPHAFVLAPSRVLAEEAAKTISEIIWPH